MLITISTTSIAVVFLTTLSLAQHATGHDDRKDFRTTTRLPQDYKIYLHSGKSVDGNHIALTSALVPHRFEFSRCFGTHVASLAWKNQDLCVCLHKWRSGYGPTICFPNSPVENLGGLGMENLAQSITVYDRNDMACIQPLHLPIDIALAETRFC